MRPVWFNEEGVDARVVRDSAEHGTLYFLVDPPPDPAPNMLFWAMAKNASQTEVRVHLFAFAIHNDTYKLDFEAEETGKWLVVRPNGKEIWSARGESWAIATLTGDFSAFKDVRGLTAEDPEYDPENDFVEEEETEEA